MIYDLDFRVFPWLNEVLPAQYSKYIQHLERVKNDVYLPARYWASQSILVHDPVH